MTLSETIIRLSVATLLVALAWLATFLFFLMPETGDHTQPALRAMIVIAKAVMLMVAVFSVFGAGRYIVKGDLD